MALIKFSEQDRRRASLRGSDLAHSVELLVRIEDAMDCEGVRCGERLEMALSGDDYETWLEFHSERLALKKHSHLVVSGRPETQAEVSAIFSE